MPAGRPSKYDPSYCEDVVELGKQGKSLAQMCSHFDVSRQTIDNWADAHSEFLEALSRAKAHAQAYWEDQGETGMKADKFNALVWKTTMQARFREDYTERQEHSHTGKDGKDLIPDREPRDLAKAVAALLSKGMKGNAGSD